MLKRFIRVICRKPAQAGNDCRSFLRMRGHPLLNGFHGRPERFKGRQGRFSFFSAQVQQHLTENFALKSIYF
jgi:hypothetical protein